MTSSGSISCSNNPHYSGQNDTLDNYDNSIIPVDIT